MGREEKAGAQDDAYVRAQEWLRKCAEGSLEAKIRKDPSLWVHPLYWTQEHLQGLNCTFEEIPDANPALEALSKRAMGLGYDLMYELQSLPFKHERADKDAIMRRILLQMANLFIPRTQIKAKKGTLRLSYGGKHAAAMHIPLLAIDQPTTVAKVMWLYLDESFLEEQHQKRKKKQPKLLLDTGTCSPYYVALFLAIAQWGKILHRQRELQGAEKQQTQKITLFIPRYTDQAIEQSLSSDTEAKSVSSLTEYTAYISDRYLQKLEDPKSFFDEKLKIQYRNVPIDAENPVALYIAMQKACSEGTKRMNQNLNP